MASKEKSKQAVEPTAKRTGCSGAMAELIYLAAVIILSIILLRIVENVPSDIKTFAFFSILFIAAYFLPKIKQAVCSTTGVNRRDDYSLEKKLEELSSINKKLKAMDENKSEFVSITAHQLRTPLTVIKGYVAMILDGDYGRLDGKMEDVLTKVLISAERLIRLTENLLNITRIESGREKYSFAETDLMAIVKSVHHDLERSAQDKKLELKIEAAGDNFPKLKIDADKIKEVMMNLADNAIKYTAKGKVVLGLENKGKSIIFSVSDTGLGVKPNELDKLFKKFSRGSQKNKTKVEGTGLGLYVAKRIIEAHRGKIWAESAGEGKGSTFSFELPITE